MKMSWIHILFLMLTLGVTILPGILAARNVKSAEDFSVGGRKSGVGLVAGSLIGTIIGGAATIGTAQLGYKLGMTAWWFTLGSGIGLLVMAFIYAVPLRKSGLTTVSEYLVVNFGKKAGYLASLSSSFGIFFSVVASTITGVNLVADIFNINYYLSGLFIILVSSCLVFFGGISGSGMAGVFKIFFIFASIFVGGFLAFGDMGTLAGMQATFTEPFWFSLFGRGVEDGLYSLVSVVVGVISTQSYAQAVYSAKDSKTAMAGCISAALVVIPVGLPSVLIGMFMHQHHPGINPISVLPMYLLTYLPHWLGGIGIGALLLSVFGSLAGLSLGISTLITRDVVQNIWKGMSAKAVLACNRLFVVICLCCAVGYVLFHIDASVLQYNYLSMALRASGIFLPLTFCVFFPHRVAPSWGIASIACGIFVGCFWKYISPIPMNSLFPALAANLVFLLIGLVQGKNTAK